MFTRAMLAKAKCSKDGCAMACGSLSADFSAAICGCGCFIFLLFMVIVAAMTGGGMTLMSVTFTC